MKIKQNTTYIEQYKWMNHTIIGLNRFCVSYFFNFQQQNSSNNLKGFLLESSEWVQLDFWKVIWFLSSK